MGLEEHVYRRRWPPIAQCQADIGAPLETALRVLLACGCSGDGSLREGIPHHTAVVPPLFHEGYESPPGQYRQHLFRAAPYRL